MDGPAFQRRILTGDFRPSHVFLFSVPSLRMTSLTLPADILRIHSLFFPAIVLRAIFVKCDWSPFLKNSSVLAHSRMSRWAVLGYRSNKCLCLNGSLRALAALRLLSYFHYLCPSLVMKSWELNVTEIPFLRPGWLPEQKGLLWQFQKFKRAATLQLTANATARTATLWS